MDSGKKPHDLFVADFSKATYQQLEQVVHHEDCDLIYKCVAETEIKERDKLIQSLANAMRWMIVKNKEVVH